MAARSKKVRYSVHPSVTHGQAIVKNLARTTGKSLEQWTTLVRSRGPADGKKRAAWLRDQHRLGGTTARLVAELADGEAQDRVDPRSYLRTAERYVEAMYAGKKAALRPIHDALIELGLALGDDVKVSPCSTIIPLYRNHVFAEIKPATQKRVDLGLALKGCKRKLSARLRDTGGEKKGDRITHRIPLSTPDEIDKQLATWLRVAYDLDA